MHTITSVCKLALQSSLLYTARFMKVSYIIGSKAAFFSATHMVAPMIGILGGIRALMIASVLKTTAAFFIGGLNPFMTLVYHIPHFFAAFYWKTEKKYLRIGLPIVCMALFLLNPAGLKAWFYPMLWLIPIVAAFFAQKNIVIRALGSTFMAHAIGSVLWLYLVPMQTTDWLIAMPLALVERCTFAAGMVAVYCGYNMLNAYWQNRGVIVIEFAKN